MSLEEIELYFEELYGPNPSILNNKEHNAIKKLIAVAVAVKTTTFGFLQYGGMHITKEDYEKLKAAMDELEKE